MAIGMICEIPNGTQKQYDEVMKHLNLQGKLPTGCLSHFAGPQQGCWCVVDVWESKEAFEKFMQQKLGSALQKAGVPPIQPKFFPVHNTLKPAA